MQADRKVQDFGIGQKRAHSAVNWGAPLRRGALRPDQRKGFDCTPYGADQNLSWTRSRRDVRSLSLLEDLIYMPENTCRELILAPGAAPMDDEPEYPRDHRRPFDKANGPSSQISSSIEGGKQRRRKGQAAYGISLRSRRHERRLTPMTVLLTRGAHRLGSLGRPEMAIVGGMAVQPETTTTPAAVASIRLSTSMAGIRVATHPAIGTVAGTHASQRGLNRKALCPDTLTCTGRCRYTCRKNPAHTRR